MITTYTQAQKYLDSFIDYEKTPFFPYQRILKPQRMHSLLENLSLDVSSLKVIHIAGTKGKGSTAGFTASILAACGLRVGIYTSPHVKDFRERIAIVSWQQAGLATQIIPQSEIIVVLNEFIPCLENLRQPQGSEEISFFELYTALALRYFLKEKVDIVVVETGLGGRLDATNIVSPCACIITHIGYDHTAVLGRTLKKIASEKAGIIKEKVPLICSAQKRSALDVIKQQCNFRRAPLAVYGEDFKVTNIELKTNVSSFDFSFGEIKLKNIQIILRGRHQVENAASALAAASLLYSKALSFNEHQVRAALANFQLEGRFETISQEPLIIVDVAHNTSSFCALRESIRLYYPAKKIIFIFAASKDKKAKDMLEAIPYRHLVLTRFSSPRSYEPSALKEISNEREAFVADSVSRALETAISFYEQDYLILISGSFFLVSEVKDYLKSRRKRVGRQRSTISLNVL